MVANFGLVLQVASQSEPVQIVSDCPFENYVTITLYGNQGDYTDPMFGSKYFAVTVHTTLF